MATRPERDDMSDAGETTAEDRATIESTTVPPIRDPTTRVFLLAGFAIWLVATVVFRLAGQYVLDPRPTVGTLPLYLVTGAAMTGLALLLYRWRGVYGATRERAAIALVLPGMVLDSVVLVWFEPIFPNVAPDAATYFGGVLLLAYAAVLLSGFVPGRA